MGELSSFSFLPGQSSLHRMDARIKLLGLMLISLLSLGAGGVSLSILSVIMIVLAADCGLQAGNFQGSGTDCSPNPCPPDPTGACCFNDGSCRYTASSAAPRILSA